MSDSEIFQVVMLPVMRPAFERWLDERGFLLYRMPDEAQDEGGLPTYGIGLMDSAVTETNAAELAEGYLAAFRRMTEKGP